MTNSKIYEILLREQNNPTHGGWVSIMEIMLEAHLSQASVIAGLKAIFSETTLEYVAGNGIISNRYRLEPKPVDFHQPPVELKPEVAAGGILTSEHSVDLPDARHIQEVLSEPEVVVRRKVGRPRKQICEASDDEDEIIKKPGSRLTISMNDAVHIGQKAVEFALINKKNKKAEVIQEATPMLKQPGKRGRPRKLLVN